MAPGRAHQAIEELYPDVMREVIQASLVDFEDAGISLRILDELKSLWQQHLTEAGIGHFPWDSSTRPIKTEPIDDSPLSTPFNLARSYGSSSTPTIPHEPTPLQCYAAVRMSNTSQGPPGQRFPRSGNETKNASPKTPQNRTLNGITAGFTPLERDYEGLGFRAYNVEYARQRAQQLVQERQQRQQQQQQQQISPAAQTTFLGIASVLGTHPGNQQILQGRDGPGMKLSGPDGQGAHQLFNPGTSPTSGTPTRIQPPQPAIVSAPKEGQPPYTRDPTTYSRSIYYSPSLYPFPNVSPQQEPPSNPPQLDGPSDSPVPDTPCPIANPTVTVTQPEAGKGASDKELTDADDNPCDDGDDEFEDVPELMVCLYDKVARSRSKIAHKWRCALRDGVLVLDGREYVFVKATGELTW